MIGTVYAASRSKRPLTRWAVELPPPRGDIRVLTVWVGTIRETDPRADVQARRVVGDSGHQAPRTRVAVIASVTPPPAQNTCRAGRVF
jgi:hypothetical protein